MKKSTLIANAVVWGILLCVTVAFQAWYRTSDFGTVQGVVQGTASGADAVIKTLVSWGIACSGPVLLCALGALLGLTLVAVKKLELSRGARALFRVLGALTVVFVAVGSVSVVAVSAGLPLPLMLLTVVFYLAPVVFVIGGFCWSVGLAPLDPNQKKPLVSGPFSPDED